MTAVLSTSDFPEYFRRLNNGLSPFPWQTRLANRVCKDGSFPPDLDLPTGTGKTACIDIALFHLAYGLANGSERKAPLRIVWVVDRRLIVDDAYERAQSIAKLLERAEEGVLKVVADLLRQAAGAGAPPLVTQVLRGGIPLEGDWARSPSQPVIISSTVDQVGSRLLFRGYGVSQRMQPIHAGLLGEDALIFLDEVHLAEPFRQTLAQVDASKEVRHKPWASINLSATPRGTHGGTAPFTLADDDWRDEKLEPRLTLPKRARLVSLGAVAYGSDDHAGHFAQQAWRAASSNGVARKTLVVVNRVSLARKVFEKLRALLPAEHGGDVTLLIGRNREAVKDEIRQHILNRCRSNPFGVLDSELERPFIVVATQCVEAGADLDFDALVTQVAPLGALRQRFGRLNRMGRPIEATAAILATNAEVAKSAKPDPIYENALRETWAWLNERLAEDGAIDFSTAALRVAGDELAVLNGPALDAPVLMPEHIGAFAKTSPAPNWSPAPSLYLHGVADTTADVNVVWRADLPADAGQRTGELVSLLLSVVPPRLGESVSVPISAARRWLDRQRALDSVSDLEGVGEAQPDEKGHVPAVRGRVAWRWRGPSEPIEAATSSTVRPGDTLVVPSDEGGCDGFGWLPQTAEPVQDVADAAAKPYAKRLQFLRLHPALYEQSLRTGQSDAVSSWPDIADRLEELHDDTGVGIARELLDPAHELHFPAAWREALEDLAKEKAVSVFSYSIDGDYDGRDGLVLYVKRGALEQGCVSEAATESDEIGLRGSVAEGETLASHSAHVRDMAMQFTSSLGLASPLADDLALAAFLHDVGKADERFQIYLAGSPWITPGTIRAKSGVRRTSREERQARRLSGLPKNWRHEVLSVRIARVHPHFENAHDPELVLWLIGTHHGYGRPRFPHSDPAENQTRSFYGFAPNLAPDEALAVPYAPGPNRFDFSIPIVSEHGMCDVDWPTMFERLQRRYGPWGLAWLEAILRLADHRASERSNAVPEEARA